jgi:hypothetical protein
MNQQASLDSSQCLAVATFCLMFFLSACGGDGSSGSESAEISAPRTRADTTPHATLGPAQFDPCDYFAEADYEAVMGAPPGTVKRSEAGQLRICTRERSAGENAAAVQVAKAGANLLDSMLERARQVDVRPTPIEAPGARVYYMDETGTLYAYKNGVYLEIFVKAEGSREKSIELAERVLERIR